MIEKKFEKLEELERRKKDLMRETQDEARKDTLLSDEDMKQLFQETSYFSVRVCCVRAVSSRSASLRSENWPRAKKATTTMASKFSMATHGVPHAGSRCPQLGNSHARFWR